MPLTNESNIRPMTAGAGYASSTSEMIKTKRGVKKSTKSTLEWAKDTEKKIHKLIEESSLLMAQGESSSAVQKANDAVNAQKQLSERMVSSDLEKESCSDMTFLVWFHLASLYEKCGMFTEAIDSYFIIQKQKKFQYQENVCRLRINMANVYRSMEKYQEAIKLYRKALDNLPREVKKLKFYIHRSIGNTFLDAGSIKEAIVEYEAVAMSLDADIETCFNLLLCYIKSGNIQKVTQTFMKIVDVYGTTSKVDEEVSGAVEIENDFKDLVVTSTRIVCRYLCRNKCDEELRWLHDQLKDRTPFIAQYIGIDDALLNISQNEFKIAIKMLKSYENKGAEISTAISINLTTIYSLEGKHEFADHHADAALASSRFNPRALVNKGNRLFIKDDFSSAREFYLDAINIDYTNFEAMYNLAITNRRLGFLTEALECFQKLLTQNKNEPRVLYQLVNIFDDTDDKNSASKWLNLLSSCLPTDPGILLRAVNIGQDLNHEGEGLSECFHNVLESHRLYPSNLDAIGHLSIWFVRQQKYEKALYFFRCASVIQPKENKWRYMMANCYRKLMKNNEAFEIYESIRSRSPHDKECLKHLIQLSREIGSSSIDYEYNPRDVSNELEAIRD